MMSKSKSPISGDDANKMLELGSWLGRRQAFGMVANRCSAGDAECLKTLRDRGEYRRLGMNWEQFCQQKAGISRRHADRLISHLEEFGSNYFRLSELIEISEDTYRLIAGSVSDEGLAHNGEKIPLIPERRRQVQAAVEAICQSKPKKSDQGTAM